jgi:glycosyltransferase involved in cell wall biosynthesis
MSSVRGLRIAYLCLQATTSGQASYAHVHEIIKGLRQAGAVVDLYEPSYAGADAPGATGRLAEFNRVQSRLISRLVEYDVLYVRGHALAWRASRAARTRGVPVIQECNGMVDDFVIAWPSARMFSGLIRYLTLTQFEHSTELIAGSAGLAGWLEREVGRTARVIPNGANAELFRPSPRPGMPLPEAYVVFFGSLAPWQGISTSLRAISDSAWPDGVSLVIAGTGSLESEVRQAAAEGGGRIVYLGHVPYRELAPVVANSVCSLVNKEQPEFEAAGISPLKLYESMACGVPVIATDKMPGLTEIVQDQSAGLIVPQGDPGELARAVAELATAPELRGEMGRSGRTYVEQECTWEARAAETARVIGLALEGGNTQD